MTKFKYEKNVEQYVDNILKGPSPFKDAFIVEFFFIIFIAIFGSVVGTKQLHEIEINIFVFVFLSGPFFAMLIKTPAAKMGYRNNNFLIDFMRNEKTWPAVEHSFDRPGKSIFRINYFVLYNYISFFIMGHFLVKRGYEEQGQRLISKAIEIDDNLKDISFFELEKITEEQWQYLRKQFLKMKMKIK